MCACMSTHESMAIRVSTQVCARVLPPVLTQCVSRLPQGASCEVCQSSPSEVGSGTSIVKVLAGTPGEPGLPGPPGLPGVGADGKQVRPLYLTARELQWASLLASLTRFVISLTMLV